MTRQEILFTNQKIESRDQGPVECLGKTFDSDEARRERFLGLLREGLEELHAKLGGVPFTTVEDAVERMKSVGKWPMGDEAHLRELAERMRDAHRKEPDKDLLQLWKDEVGFPHGSIEDILNLSDPPYYTACPNPFIGDFIKHYGKPYDPETDDYRREPFAADVSEGKNDPIYNAHSYHTKVPHKAIIRYILHYTEPGDVVFDGFCGTGMTGVAGALCEELGTPRTPLVNYAARGQRFAILSDLSPIATFIASNLLRPFARSSFLSALEMVCSDVEDDFGRLYKTRHTGWRVRDRKHVEHKTYEHRGEEWGSVEFTLYSDVVQCPECSSETTYYEVAVDEQNDALRKDIRCPQCNAVVPETKWEPVYSTVFDPILNRTIRQLRIEPVLINYTVGSTRYEKLPDAHDKALSDEAAQLLRSVSLPPIELIPGRETQRNAPIGITHLHHFFTPREHLFIAALLRRIRAIEDIDIRFSLLFALTATLPYASRLRRFRADRKGGGPLSGTLYVSSLVTPPHVIKTFKRNAATIADCLTPSVDPRRGHIISTQSAGHLENIPSNSVDYIFTDPPFGHNFDYSELNFFWEGFFGVVTEQNPEAIVSKAQEKGIDQYRELMEASFAEYYRILKPGRWMTVEFSNTKASVWNAIQTALERSGFVVANVASLDKRQHSFKAVMTPTAVKQDLVISAYKPNSGLEERFKLKAGSEEGVWDFVRTHLKQLPVFVSKDGQAEPIPERQSFLLFDRMVAFHVQRGVTVPLSAAEFYAGLAQRFPERDGMYFLPEQVAEYDKKRMKVKEVLQLQLFVTDEASATDNCPP